MEKHVSRLCVIENIETGERYLYDWVTEKYNVKKFRKITTSIPIDEKYWDLPRLKDYKD